jgi:protein-L-isoaspartate O-methyltransferase
MLARKASAMERLNALADRMREAKERQAAKRERFQALGGRKPWQATVVTSHNLFPTPLAIVARMVEAASLSAGMSVLEPSCGTGRILSALSEDYAVDAVEVHPVLANDCRARFPFATVYEADFLRWHGGTYDRIIMNPPFERGLDCQHIAHACTMLRPGGRLVALCYDGATQAKRLRPIATTWEPLPAGSFASEGTQAGVVMLTMEA